MILRPLTFGLASPIGARFGYSSVLAAPRSPLGGHAGVDVLFVSDAGRSVPLLVVALSCQAVVRSCHRPFAASVANSVDASDLGVAQGIFNTTISLGTVTGIQVVLLALGDATVHGSHDFLAPYAIGAGGATAMLAASFLLSDQRRSKNST